MSDHQAMGYAGSQIDTACEALQMALTLAERFRADYNELTAGSAPDVKWKAYGLFLQAITMGMYSSCV